MMNALEYWKECIAIAADEIAMPITADQLEHLAGSVMGGHENYGMAFYSPPSSDRLYDIEREWKDKFASLEKEFEAYRDGAEKAIKRALPGRVYHDESVSIDNNGDVFSHGGRTTQIL